MFRKSIILLLSVVSIITIFAGERNIYSDFALTNEKMKSVSMEKWKGEVLVVNFWADWCSPCIKELPQLQSLYNQFNGKVNIVAVSVENHPEKIAGFIQKHNILLPVLIDTKEQLSDYLRVSQIPSTYVFDGSGNLVMKQSGYSQKGLFEIRRTLDKLTNP